MIITRPRRVGNSRIIKFIFLVIFHVEISQRPLERILDLFLIPKIRIFFEKNFENRPKNWVFRDLKAGSSRIKIFDPTS
jgi:hypothetical protein